jgi:hydrogenase-4 component F
MSALELFSPAGLAPFCAFLAAAVLALVPSWRVGAWINVAASCLCFLAACWLPWLVGTGGPLLLVDRLAAHLALLTAFVAMTTSWFSLSYVNAEIAAQRIDRRRLRLYHAMYQLFVGGMLLALLSNNLGLTWVAIETATIAAALLVGLGRTSAAMEASWKLFIICGVGIVLALFGTALLYLAALPAVGPGLPAMNWSTIIPAAGRCNGPLLNLGFVFLLIGYATTAGLVPLHAWMADTYAEGPTPASAVLAGSMLNVALLVILRLRGIMAANATAIDPGPPIMALGLLSLLLAAFSLWRQRDVKRFFAFSTIGQSGVVAFAFGLGGPAAIFAGVLHMTLHTLIHASVFQCVGRAARLKGGQTFADIGGLIAAHRMFGLTLAAGIVALAALPPFGLFASEFLIVADTLRRAPLASIPLGIGLVAGAWALIMRLQSLCLGTPTPDRRSPPNTLAPDALALAPVWLQLAIVLLLGLAMPGPVVAWFTAIAGAAR